MSRAGRKHILTRRRRERERGEGSVGASQEVRPAEGAQHRLPQEAWSHRDQRPRLRALAACRDHWSVHGLAPRIGAECSHSHRKAGDHSSRGKRTAAQQPGDHTHRGTTFHCTCEQTRVLLMTATLLTSCSLILQSKSAQWPTGTHLPDQTRQEGRSHVGENVTRAL